jgi:hypothetical protein
MFAKIQLWLNSRNACARVSKCCAKSRNRLHTILSWSRPSWYAATCLSARLRVCCSRVDNDLMLARHFYFLFIFCWQINFSRCCCQLPPLLAFSPSLLSPVSYPPPPFFFVFHSLCYYFSSSSISIVYGFFSRPLSPLFRLLPFWTFFSRQCLPSSNSVSDWA